VVLTVAAALAAPAAARANDKLIATVGHNEEFTITLKDVHGALVTTLPAGTYDIEVHDESASHNFHLTGPGGLDMSTTVPEITMPSVTWTLTLAPGSYHYQCDPHLGIMKGDFTVTAPPPPQATLTVATDGDGRVTSDPAAIDCPGTCTATLNA